MDCQAVYLYALEDNRKFERSMSLGADGGGPEDVLRVEPTELAEAAGFVVPSVAGRSPALIR